MGIECETPIPSVEIPTPQKQDQNDFVPPVYAAPVCHVHIPNYTYEFSLEEQQLAAQQLLRSAVLNLRLSLLFCLVSYLSFFY